MSASTSSCACPESLDRCWSSKAERDEGTEKKWKKEGERGSVVRGRCREIVLGLVYDTGVAGVVEFER